MFPSSTKTSATDSAIQPVAGGTELDACRELFVEYQQSLGVSLCFQGFDKELEALPGDYAPPSGGLWIARWRRELAGCVAFRALTSTIAEMKRLYVRPAYRGLRLGRTLAELVVRTARETGYDSIRLDTLPSLVAARALYERMGFVETERYNDNPVEGVRYYACDLRPLTQRV